MSSSEWQRPETDPFARVWAEVKRARRDAEQRVNYLLRNAGLRVAEGALHVLQRLVVEGDQEVTGSLDVSGDAEFTGDTSIGGTLGVTGETTLGGDTTISGDTDVTGDLDVEGRAGFTGDTTIGGNLAVVGTLSLPSGIIDNDALANPIAVDSGVGFSDGGAITTTATVKATTSIPVPAGFTTALVKASGRARGANTTASLGFLQCQVEIDGITGGTTTMPIESEISSSVWSLTQRTLTGLVGGSAIEVSVLANAWPTGWADTPNNNFIVNADVTFLR